MLKSDSYISRLYLKSVLSETNPEIRLKQGEQVKLDEISAKLYQINNDNPLIPIEDLQIAINNKDINKVTYYVYKLYKIYEHLHINAGYEAEIIINLATIINSLSIALQKKCLELFILILQKVPRDDLEKFENTNFIEVLTNIYLHSTEYRYLVVVIVSVLLKNEYQVENIFSNFDFTLFIPDFNDHTSCKACYTLYTILSKFDLRQNLIDHFRNIVITNFTLVDQNADIIKAMVPYVNLDGFINDDLLTKISQNITSKNAQIASTCCDILDLTNLQNNPYCIDQVISLFANSPKIYHINRSFLFLLIKIINTNPEFVSSQIYIEFFEKLFNLRSQFSYEIQQPFLFCLETMILHTDIDFAMKCVELDLLAYIEELLDSNDSDVIIACIDILSELHIKLQFSDYIITSISEEALDFIISCVDTDDADLSESANNFLSIIESD